MRKYFGVSFFFIVETNTNSFSTDIIILHTRARKYNNSLKILIKVFRQTKQSFKKENEEAPYHQKKNMEENRGGNS